jgi:glutamine amidotransferase
VNEVVVVDYGAGNTRSVCAALTHLGRDSVVTSDPASLRDATFVILPGVGSARSAMVHLNDSGAAMALKERFRGGGTILGICLGLQLAMEHSDEDGGVTCLGLLPGDVVRLDEIRVPRLGWSVVEPWGEAFYFAHSYAVRSKDVIASVDGVTVAVRRDAFLGVQFHPEKSGPAGLEFLDQCLSLV